MKELLGKLVLDLYPDTPHGRGRAAILARFRNGETIGGEELKMQTAEGVRIWVSLSVNPIRDSEGRVVESRSIAADITERKQAQEAVRSVALFPEQNPAPVLRIDADGSLLYANAGARSLLEYCEQKTGNALPEPLASGARSALASGVSEEVEILAGDRKLSFALAPIQAHNYVNLYGRDVTELRRIQRREEEARTLAAVSQTAVDILNSMGEGVLLLDMEGRIVSVNPAMEKLTGIPAEEQERRRVSTRIHDTVIQTLSLGNIRLGAIRDAVEAAGLSEQREKVEHVRKIMDTGIAECRGLMAALSPPLLYELGLGPALKDFARRQQDKHGLTVTVEEGDSPQPLDEAQRGFLFQAARELVLNAAKHAGPCEVSVSLSGTDDAVVLEVRDTGCGFDPSDLNHHITDFDRGGFGLFNIRERLRGMGGRLEIASAPGKGTTVSALLRGAYDFTADVVLVDGQPCAKAGRTHRPNSRLAAVQ